MDDFKIACPHCSARLSVAQRRMGRATKCPACGREFVPGSGPRGEPEPEWFIAKDGERVGPYSFDQLKAMAVDGRLTLTDMVWQNGMVDWIEAHEVDRLFDESPVRFHRTRFNDAGTQTTKPDYVNTITQAEGVNAQAKGVNGQIEVLSNKIRILRRGILGLLTQGLKGDKEILISSITSIQFKNAGVLMNGYIQFGFMGGSEAKGGISQAVSDENTVMFTIAQQAEFIRVKQIIENQMHPPITNASSVSAADELEKLAALRDRGILSETEFQQQKKKLLES